jgi:hypothetical protein
LRETGQGDTGYPGERVASALAYDAVHPIDPDGIVQSNTFDERVREEFETLNSAPSEAKCHSDVDGDESKRAAIFSCHW